MTNTSGNNYVKLRVILCLTMISSLPATARLFPFNGRRQEFVGAIHVPSEFASGCRNPAKTSAAPTYERIGQSLRLNGAMTSENEFYLDEFDRGSKTESSKESLCPKIGSKALVVNQREKELPLARGHRWLPDSRCKGND
jgi:hypothetical protein